MTAPLPCPSCKRAPTIVAEYVGYSCVCLNCYDADCTGDPPTFTSRSPQGTGATRAETIDNWNDAVEEAIS